VPIIPDEVSLPHPAGVFLDSRQRPRLVVAFAGEEFRQPTARLEDVERQPACARMENNGVG
jgi:hypothetical protein